MNWPRGEVAELETETVMGWAARLDDWPATEKLMRRKSRPLGDEKQFALALSVENLLDELKKYAKLNELAERLVREYLPGRLTLVLWKNPEFRHPYFDSYDTIGVRVPEHQPLQAVLRAEGPILLTSANERGGTPVTLGGRPTAVWRIDGEKITVLRDGDLKPPVLG
jgi:L-threonylcarbamoyladenylate synthase